MTTIEITCDSPDDVESALERVLELIREGYTSGIEPAWSITEN